MTPEELKADIFEKVKAYYRLVHAPVQHAPFVPGQSRVNYAGRVFDEQEMSNLVDAALDFWLTNGCYSKRFEREFASFLGVPHCLLTNSGSSANLLALMALTSPLLKERRLRRGDEVITTAACFPTMITPIIQYGAVPVFADISLGTYDVNVAMLEKSVSKKTRAVILAHTLGNPFDIRAVKSFCEKHRLFLIEDNCDALGSRYEGVLTGTFGDMATHSFYPAHHITTGEGGAVCTKDPLLAKILLSLRDWGRDCWCSTGKDNTCGKRFAGCYGTLPEGYDHKYVYSHLGYNMKATDMQAAIGCAQLAKVERFTSARRENFEFLYQHLRRHEDIFILPEATRNSEPSWFGFLLTLRDSAKVTRQALVEFLEKRKIQTRNLFAGNIIRHPCFEDLKKGKDYRVVGNLEQTDKVMRDAFWVGVYPGMTKDMMKYTVDQINSILSFGR